MSLYFEANPPGLTSLTGLQYDPERPARHCRICGRSYQPPQARTDAWLTDPAVKWEVEKALREWAIQHNKTHSERVHRSFRSTHQFLTAEAALKLAPLGIYPVQDMIFSDEVEHAARIAPRAPKDDVDGH